MKQTTREQQPQKAEIRVDYMGRLYIEITEGTHHFMMITDSSESPLALKYFSDDEAISTCKNINTGKLRYCPKTELLTNNL